MGASETSRAIVVLHVDDDPEFLDIAATFMQRADDRFAVVTATSVAEAERHLDHQDVDCIVSDHEMPDRSGLEFLEDIRDRDDDIPFILFTGRGSETIASEAISSGVTDYLQKGGGTDQYTVLANRITNAVERHRSGRALVERNRALRRYKLMVDSMGEAACIYDAEGRFELVNDFLAEWYGMSPEALVGRESALIPEIQSKTDGDPYAELLAGNREEITGELEAEFPGHGRAVLEYRLTPLTVKGDVEGVVGVARDITARRERETALAESNARLKALFEQSPDMINIHDRQGTIIDPNPSLCAETGYSKEELEGMKVWELDERIDPDEARGIWDDMSIGDRERVRGRYRRRDGSTVDVEVHIRRLDLEGQDCFMVISRRLGDTLAG